MSSVRAGLVLEYIEIPRDAFEKRSEVRVFALYGKRGQMAKGNSWMIKKLKRGERRTWEFLGLELIPMTTLAPGDLLPFELAAIEDDGGGRRAAEHVSSAMGKLPILPTRIGAVRRILTATLRGIIRNLFGGADDIWLNLRGTVRAEIVAEMDDRIEVASDKVKLGLRIVRAEVETGD